MRLMEKSKRGGQKRWKRSRGLGGRECPREEEEVLSTCLEPSHLSMTRFVIILKRKKI